ncbi:MAG: glycosyltransferase family 2 protein [Oxalobacter formigenes]|nr:glycosyltransferase family 2 protein [Oxalobacter formigenes]
MKKSRYKDQDTQYIVRSSSRQVKEECREYGISDETFHMPQISIIVPIYNAEKYLSECLDSILLQTFTDFEIICVNDGSTDNSAKILEKYKKLDKRIKIITHKNQGVVFARNNAIKKAKGEFIYILDSDDIIEETTLEKSYKAITAGKGDIITCRVFNFGRNSGGELRFPTPNKRNMATGNCLVNAALFRKKLFDKSGGFDTTFTKGIEDYDFYLNACYRQNAKFYRIPEILFFYRKKPINESRQLQFEKYHYEKLTNKLNIKYPEIKKYRVLKKICEFLFHIRHKKNLIIIKLFKIPLFTIKYTRGKINIRLAGGGYSHLCSKKHKNSLPLF